MNDRSLAFRLLRNPAIWSIGISTVVLFISVLQGNISLRWTLLAITAGLAGTGMVVWLAWASGGRVRWADWGAAAGVMLGLAIGDYILGIPWNNGGQRIPFETTRLIGPGMGAVGGALIGALASRVMDSPTPVE